jgi:DNA-binding NarL/FixJ family response regulator
VHDPWVKVLVVDPSDAVRSRLVQRLRDAGLDVVGETGTIAGALALAAIAAPDAIVADVLLADRRGAAVVISVRALAPAAWVVVLTNATHYREACLTHGADVFLDKSTEFDLVAATLLQRGARPRPKTGPAADPVR